MNLRQLEIFGAVMSTGTTVSAARMLCISQPAVSNMIAHMEAQLGFRLFDRAGGRLRPTHEAVLLYEKARHVFQAFEATQQVADQIKHQTVGFVRIAALHSLAQALAPRAVAAFHKPRPNVRVTLDVLAYDDLFEALENDQADLGFIYMHQPIDHPIVKTRMIFESEMVCGVARGHPLSRASVLDPAKIAGERLVCYPSSHGYGGILDTAFAQYSVRRRTDIEVQFTHTACKLVANGAGVALVDPFVLLDDSLREQVVAVPFRPVIPIALYVAHSKWRPLSHLACAVVDQLVLTLQELQNEGLLLPGSAIAQSTARRKRPVKSADLSPATLVR